MRAGYDQAVLATGSNLSQWGFKQLPFDRGEGRVMEKGWLAKRRGVAEMLRVERSWPQMVNRPRA